MPGNRKKEARKTDSLRFVLLLQDNAPAWTSQVAMTAVTECGLAQSRLATMLSSLVARRWVGLQTL